MFRARIDAVNGSKVFAGGKWLNCIGNKPIRVGEYIWTDGRCVYGNFQLPQQPLVITTPDDEEGIPIVIRGNDKSAELYSFTHGHLNHVGTFPKSDSGLNYSCMINDKKRNAFISVGNDFNIDDKGNFFSLSRFDKENQEWVDISKNGTPVKEINLSDLEQTILDTIPDPPHMDDPGWDGGSLYPGYDHSHYSYFEFFGSPFVENENDWYFFIVGDGRKTAFTYVRIGGGYTIYDNLVDFSIIACVKPDGVHLLECSVIQAVAEYGSSTAQITSSTKEYGDPIKLSIGDGFYRIASIIPPDPNAYGVEHGGRYNSKYFSPNGEQLFVANDFLSTVCRIAKTKSGHLLYLYNFENEIEGIDEIEGIESYEIPSDAIFLLPGLYLLSNNKLKILLDCHCINQRLRPMKKFKGWQNRLKEF